MTDFLPGAAPTSRRAFLGTAAAVVGGTLFARPLLAASALPTATVYKDAGCGCCKEWVKHLQQAGFTVESRDTSDMDSVKASFGVPAALASCHTARVGVYAIEGHVPADLIVKLLTEKPANARGLAAPGMPNRAPGMQQPGPQPPYDVILFEKTGKTRVYATR
jgi:hypothetical protein